MPLHCPLPPPAPGAPAPGAPAPAPGTPGGGPGPDRSGKDWIANPGLDTEGKNAINNDEYQIQTGDTLNTILERAYGKDNVAGKMDEIVKANAAPTNIKNPDLIYAGDTIKLPGANPSPTASPASRTPTEPAGAHPRPGPRRTSPVAVTNSQRRTQPRSNHSPGTALVLPGAPVAPVPVLNQVLPATGSSTAACTHPAS